MSGKIIRTVKVVDGYAYKPAKEIQTVMGELFRKASAIKTVEGGDNA